MILDFDGVLVDSAPECWLRCVDASQIVNSLKSLDYSSPVKDLFLLMRHLVGPAHEFYFLIKSLEEYSNATDVEKNFIKLANEDKKNALEFKQIFFKCRAIAKKNNLQGWIESNNFHDPVIRMAQRFSKVNKLYVATMKDEDSVKELLKYKNVNCSASKVLGLSYGDNKYNHLSYVLEQHSNLSNDDFLFMDDNIRHIKEVSCLGISSMLATWGYGTKDSIEFADKNYIKTINLEDCNKVMVYD
jgi:phosphoglycolate phosphatase-like HAD superfamily hydrolase